MKRACLVIAALILIAAAPAGDEAQRLGKRLAEASDFSAMLSTIGEAQIAELQAAHPELSEAQKNELAATARTELDAKLAPLVARLGAIYAAHFTLSELREIVAFYDSPAGQRYSSRLTQTMPALAKSVGEIDFKGDAIKAYCAKTGKACPVE